MVRSTILSAAALAGSALASPLGARQTANIDTTVLQFALTLEHLENVFYKQALKNFTLQDFEAAGYSADYYNDLKYIAYDEQSHVELLSSALTAAGVTPNQACSYAFPYTDVPSFITLSSVLEGVGTSAYLGGAPLITSKAYLTVAGSILVTEALHTSLQRLAINEIPNADPYGTPLDPNSVYSLAVLFITSCPPTNMALPFTAFPTLAVNGQTATDEEPIAGPSNVVRRGESWRGHHGGNGWPKQWQPNANTMSPPCAGDEVTFTAANNGTIKDGSFVTFVSGLNVISVPGKIDGSMISATIPAATDGQSYVFVTSSNITTLTDSAIEYGPAVVEVRPQPPVIDYSES